MDKTLFVKSIEAIRDNVRLHITRAELLTKLYPNSFAANLINTDSNLIDCFIDLLKEQMNDKDNWIEHFCWELNFGEENYRLKVLDKEGKEIPLTTAEDLWDLLNSKGK